MTETVIGKNTSVIGDDILKSLGSIKIEHPVSTFAITPASLIGLEAIDKHSHLLQGTGIDWGCGTGCLSIVAAKINEVRMMYGLDIVPNNIKSSTQNALLNAVTGKTKFLISDSFHPVEKHEQVILEALIGKIDFIISNPPSSSGDDGFSFRRKVLQEGYEYLKPDGIVFLNISQQYGNVRIKELSEMETRYKNGGVLASTEQVEFSLGRTDLLECIQAYADEEKLGGTKYEFNNPMNGENEIIDARTAITLYEKHQKNPLTKWQVHLFRKCM
jgi:SAM-dependent methyltransferase